MKKNYFLTLLLTLITAVSFGQVLVADDFTYADGALVPNGGWTQNTGTAGTFLVASGEAVINQGTGSEDVRRTFTAVAGDVYAAFDVSVDAITGGMTGTDFEYFAHFGFNGRVDIVAPTAAGDYTLGISTNTSTAQATWATDLTFDTKYRVVLKYDQVAGVASIWIDPTAETDTSISGNVDTTPGTITTFDFRQSGSSSDEIIRADNLMVGQTFNDVLVFAAPTEPALTINTPTDGTEFAPGTTSVDVTIDVQNFTFSADNGSGMGDGSGDGYIKQTLVTPSGTFVESKFDASAQMIAVADGEAFTITMELVDNTGASLSPAVTQTTNFSVATITQVANIAALRAGTEGQFYELTGEAIMTYSRANRNQKYIQDATAAILIDDNAGAITTVYNQWDGITGIKGELGSFNGTLQFIPTEDSGAATSTGNSITPEEITLATFEAATADEYESELILIKNVTFVIGDTSAGIETFTAGDNFVASRSYRINDTTSDSVFRTNFSEADYIGTAIPTPTTVDMTVIGAEFSGALQVVGINLAGIVLTTPNNQIEGFGVYPNPVENQELTIRTSSSDTKEVTLYNVLGRKVLSQNFSGNQKSIDVSSVNTGVYILKVVENGKTSTKKLVVK